MDAIANETLAELANHPAWKELYKVSEERMEMHFRVLVREFATKGVEPNYAELQYQRGFFAGMKFLLDNPGVEYRKLQRELEKERKDVS